MSQLNIELFKQVRDKIATVPEAYDQDTGGSVSREAPCGTRACVAGWAVALSVKDGSARIREMGWVDIHSRARKLLGISRDEAHALFHPDPDRNWPEPFRGLWFQAGTGRARAKVAVKYLDRIIKTGKVL